jgi:hypothetical protein
LYFRICLGGDYLAEVLEPITFIQEIDGSKIDLIVPEEFVRDLHFSTKKHLMIMLRVVGTDSKKVSDFFEDGEEKVFTLKTIEANHNLKVDDNFILTSLYMDEGPPISVDIDQEPYMVRLIMDFERVN